MTETTPLDTAHAAMDAAPDDDAARLAFLARVAEAELFLLLTRPADGGTADPQIFPLSDGPVVLAFDREERLAAFADGAPVPYLALSGRNLARLLAGRGLGLGLNLGVAPSSFLMGADGVDWLAATVPDRPAEVAARPQDLIPPGALPERLIVALDGKLAQAAGLATVAYLAGVRYEGGATGHLLAIIGAAPGAEGALAQAVAEALAFSGLDAATLDVGFFDTSDPIAARLARVGLRFDLPEPPTPEPVTAPGSDPTKPPRLR
ncbi:MAG: SseB family protein [Rhodobacteraceae bacterium]|jgi:hypothetical protein|nr:SseB family protein [Paracoccaceae bacterium]